MSTTKIRLTLDVVYNLNSESAQEMASRLQKMCEQAIGNGMLTGETNAEIDEYSMETKIMPDPLSEDELAGFMLHRIENGKWETEDITVRLARFGLMEPDAFVGEMRERMKMMAQENSESVPELIPDALLTPSVQAEVHTDDQHLKVEFDATRWFAQASVQEIMDLQAISWRGDYAADAVAEYYESTNSEIADLLKYCRSSRNNRGDIIGFECSVDETEAMEWLKQHRNHVWIKLEQDGS